MHGREIPCGACPIHRLLAGCDVNKIGEIDRHLLPDNIRGDEGEGAGRVGY